MAKDNICVIYDDDESYAKRLMGIINDSKDIPYRAKVFTKEEEFNRYIDVLYGNVMGIIVMTICLLIYAAAVMLAQKITDINI